MREVPRKQPADADGQVFYIREKVPSGFQFVSKKPFAKGGHNEAFRVQYGRGSQQYLFRKNTDNFDPSLERELAAEISYSIRFAAAGIAPKLYDFGYCPVIGSKRGYYWQVMEMFDESLHQYNRRISAAECAARWWRRKVDGEARDTP